MATFTWTNVTTIQTFVFPALLKTISTIADTMKRFPYWRADFHVEVKMQSTPYHQGALIAAWVPLAQAPPVDKWLLSGYNSASTLNASTQDSASFDIPWLHPSDWINWLANPVVAKLYITPLNTLMSSSPSITASVPINIFARFVNFKVSGFYSQSNKPTKKNVEAHMKDVAGLDVKSVVSTASHMLRKAPVVGPVWGAVASAINAFAGDLAKPQSTQSVAAETPTYFRQNNQVDGVELAPSFSMYQNPQIETAPTFFGMDSSHQTIANIAKTPFLLAQYTFNGTDNLWQSDVSPTPQFGGILNGTICPYPSYLMLLANAWRFWRGSIKFCFEFIVPMFYSCRFRIFVTYEGAVVPVNYGDLTEEIVDIKGYSHVDVMVPYLNAVPWLDNTVGLTTSPCINVQQLTPIMGSSLPSVPVVMMNVYIAGGEDTQFAVPMATTTSVPVTHTKVKEPTKTSDLTKSLIFASASSQMNIRQVFSQPFKGLNRGIQQTFERGQVMPECSGTVSDMCRRTTTTGIVGNFFPLISGYGDGGLHFYSRFFIFWRGGRNCKCIRSSSTISTSGSFGLDGWYLDVAGYGDPGVRFENGYQYLNAAPTIGRVEEHCHVPYYCAQAYYPVRAPGDDYVEFSCYNNVPIDALFNMVSAGSSTDVKVRAMSAADDFLLLYLVPWALHDYATLASRTKTAKTVRGIQKS